MTEAQIKIIVGRMKKLAQMEGYALTDTAEKIARAKIRCFGMDAWYHCPCGNDADRHCIGDKCKLEIAMNGTCHCKAYTLKKNFIDKIKSGDYDKT